MVGSSQDLENFDRTTNGEAIQHKRNYKYLQSWTKLLIKSFEILVICVQYICLGMPPLPHPILQLFATQFTFNSTTLPQLSWGGGGDA